MVWLLDKIFLLDGGIKVGGSASVTIRRFDCWLINWSALFE